MTLVLLLFSIGIVLIAVEVIVPGGILGTLGAILFFAGCVLTFLAYGNWIGLAAIVVALAIGGLAIFLEFWILPKTKIGQRAFLKAEVTGVSAAIGKEALDLIGKSADALTMLSPSGYVRVDGQRYEAFCQSGQVPVGAALQVIGADNFRLIVTPSHPPKQP
jgi:membrane-bound serine protease (ClpP class)